MLGLSPPEIERLAPPETCGETLCQWRSGRRTIFLVQNPSALGPACEPRAIVIANIEAPAGYLGRCQLAALITADSIAGLGGATITETPLGPAIARAWPPDIRRPWTPRRRHADQE
jgi:hypothetical protein